MSAHCADRPHKTSIVIAARNNDSTLGAQLEALERASREVCEIIVVDNASEDRTRAVATKHVGVRVIECPVGGLAAARNAGIRAARAKKVLICDGDDVVGDGWCGWMSEALDHYDVVGGPLDYNILNVPALRRTRANLHALELPILDGVPRPSGANMGFRREVFDALHGFDEEFLHGCEDDDFAYRAQRAGFSIGFAPQAVVAYRLRSTPVSAARQAANYTYGNAQFRAKHQIAQPRRSRVLRAARHCSRIVCFWRCTTRSGRFEYFKAWASAIAAWRAYRTYGIVAGP